MKNFCYIILTLFFASCASKPLVDVDDIKLTRDEPKASCQSLGVIDVKSISVKPNEKQMMDEMRTEARKKGADFVKIEGMGAMGTSLRGQAYNCNES
jgi:hypothetical protein